MDKLTRIDRARQAAQKAADLCRTALAHLEAVEPESPAIGDLRAAAEELDRARPVLLAYGPALRS